MMRVLRQAARTIMGVGAEKCQKTPPLRVQQDLKPTLKGAKL